MTINHSIFIVIVILVIISIITPPVYPINRLILLYTQIDHVILSLIRGMANTTALTKLLTCHVTVRHYCDGRVSYFS